MVIVLTLSTNSHTFFHHIFWCKGRVFGKASCSVFRASPETFTAAFVLVFGHKSNLNGLTLRKHELWFQFFFMAKRDRRNIHGLGLD